MSLFQVRNTKGWLQVSQQNRKEKEGRKEMSADPEPSRTLCQYVEEPKRLKSQVLYTV